MALRLLIADDHRLILRALRRALEGAEDIEVVAEAQRGSQVLPLLHRERPDLCLLDVRMPEHVEVALYRIAQEALQNMVKHAKAGLAWVGLSFGNGTARLEVADDGVGFDVPTAWDSGGFGLRSMRERAELVGGRLSVRSRPGGGTSITVTAPAIALP